MEKQEAVLLISKIQTIYPRFLYGQTKDELKLAARAWHELLEDKTLDECLIALKRHAMTSKWPPSVMEIRGEIAEVENKIDTGGEAWERCLKVALDLPIGNDIIWDLSRYDLSELELKALRSIGIRDIKMSCNLAIERSNFLRIYESLKERAEKNNKISQEYRNDSLRLSQQQQSKLLTCNDTIIDHNIKSIGEVIEIKRNDYYPENFFDGITNPMDMMAKVLGVRRKQS
jgi:hypothetical protein